jgi:DNA-binding response OmpR family regulator
MTGSRILIVEDDPSLSRVLREELALEGFDVQCAGNGNVALKMANDFLPNLILLDIMLPGRNGFELCQMWNGSGIPVIVLSVRAQKHDKVRALKAGADDYVTKPFEFEELLARIDAVLRRSSPPLDRVMLGSATIDFANRKAWNNHGPIHLTFREFEVLRFLAKKSNTIVHRDELLREVWGYSTWAKTRAIDHAIARLRRKLEADPHHPQVIYTVRGDGYYLLRDPRTTASARHRNRDKD